jgi:hypothetical protein
MTKVVVYHERYGCDTGCCGHAIYVDGEREGFELGSPFNETPREYAERIVAEELGSEHVADLDWDNCLIIEDCEFDCTSWYGSTIA